MMDWSSFSIGNAAGFIKGSGNEFDDILRSAATDITIGSITLDQRDGNPGQVYHLEEDGTSINSLGLPNPGKYHFLTRGPDSDLYRKAKKAGKILRFSIACFDPKDYSSFAHALSKFGKIEINFGCPNVWGESGQKPIPSFNLSLMDEILGRMGEVYLGLDVKLSPYSDPGMIPEVADILKRHKIANVVTCNTFPNGVAFRDRGVRAIDTPNGFGGVAGNALHLIALGQVAQFASALEGSSVGVIGVGGINSGKRLVEMREVGASGVQIGTHFGENGAKVFSEILQEAIALTE
jgi:dihydroorotate dehydrogenase